MNGPRSSVFRASCARCSPRRGTALRTGVACALGALTLTALAALPAAADPSTGRIRVLDCGSGQLTVELGPAEFLTTTTAAIHVVGSTTVLNPREVTITFPDGSTITTLNKKVKGNEIACSYTNPAGLFVQLSGVLSGSGVSQA